MMSLLTNAYESITGAGMSGGGGLSPMPDCVLMVYGLSAPKFNCVRVFNLFCLYGNVIRVCSYMLDLLLFASNKC